LGVGRPFLKGDSVQIPLTPYFINKEFLIQNHGS